MVGNSAIQIRPRADTNIIGSGRMVLVTGSLDGQISEDAPHGLLMHETRMLSRYRYRIDDQPFDPATLSNIGCDSWMGYYIQLPSGCQGEKPEQAIELRVFRTVGAELREELELTNFTRQRICFRFTLDMAADFADQIELSKRKRRQFGELSREWRTAPAHELIFDYRASHRYEGQGDNSGESHVHRALVVRVDQADSEPRYEIENLSFQIELEPLASWRAHLTFAPRIFDDDAERQIGEAPPIPETRPDLLGDATSFHVPGEKDLSFTVLENLRVSALDLAAFELNDLDQGGDGWTVGAGFPDYVALFGRDSLVAAWESALLSSRLKLGPLVQLARRQCDESNEWRDMQPMRLLHQAHTGPMTALNFNPRRHYYGTITSPAFFPSTLVELWRWTGDKETAAGLTDSALKALRWLDEYATLRNDGFYYYQTRSEQGDKNQAWKDSEESFVHEDGSQAETPIAACEIQGYVYSSKMYMSEMLWALGRQDEARVFEHQARELKKRFNDRFWMEDAGFYAMGLDKDGGAIRSIASDPLHCVTTGIACPELARRVCERLFAEDMFSGWGVRTLSSRHPSYNPYSYQRGTIWPFEQAAFAIGLWRYGFFDLLERLSKAYFEAAELFPFRRWPEVFGGQPRDGQHPFPSIYTESQWPQAWSATSSFCVLQAMLGVYPYAPMRALMVDPHLPRWLPEITLAGLKVGGSRATIRFFRAADGSSSYDVLACENGLRIVRQPSAVAVVSGNGEAVHENVTRALSHAHQAPPAE